MNQHCLDYEISNDICECIECYNKATTTIEVKVGVLGVIPLFLCFNCVRKFNED